MTIALPTELDRISHLRTTFRQKRTNSGNPILISCSVTDHSVVVMDVCTSADQTQLAPQPHVRSRVQCILTERGEEVHQRFRDMDSGLVTPRVTRVVRAQFFLDSENH